MNAHHKKVEELTIADLETFAVWQFANSDAHPGETVVRPLKKTPVKNLNGRLVGTPIRLANGSDVWALLGNIDPNNPRLTRHFLTLTIFLEGKQFTMARYHDFDSDGRGPQALAAFLRLPLDAIFPISYDISRFCIGKVAALIGTIPKDPEEKLTRAQIIALAVP